MFFTETHSTQTLSLSKVPSMSSSLANSIKRRLNTQAPSTGPPVPRNRRNRLWDLGSLAKARNDFLPCTGWFPTYELPRHLAYIALAWHRAQASARMGFASGSMSWLRSVQKSTATTEKCQRCLLNVKHLRTGHGQLQGLLDPNLRRQWQWRQGAGLQSNSSTSSTVQLESMFVTIFSMKVVYKVYAGFQSLRRIRGGHSP